MISGIAAVVFIGVVWFFAYALCKAASDWRDDD